MFRFDDDDDDDKNAAMFLVAAGNRNDLQMSSLSQYLVLHVVMQDTSLMKKICSVVPCDSNSCVGKMNLGPQKKFKFYLLAVLH